MQRRSKAAVWFLCGVAASTALGYNSRVQANVEATATATGSDWNSTTDWSYDVGPIDYGSFGAAYPNATGPNDDLSSSPVQGLSTDQGGSISGYDVVIGSPFTPANPVHYDETYPAEFTQIDALTIDTGSALVIDAGTTQFYEGGPIANNGTLTLASSAGLNIDGDQTLSGSGSLVLSSGSILVNAFFGPGGAVLTNSSTISGTGQISITLSNTGSVNANSNGNTLLVASVTNTGLLEATNGGLLNLGLQVNSNNAAITNAGGTIESNGGTVQITNSTTVTGGTLTSAPGSEVDLSTGVNGGLNGVTVASGGNVVVLAGNNTSFNNTITNNGTITLNNNASNNAASIMFNGTLAGAGNLVLNAYPTSPGTAGIGNDGNNGYMLTNNSTISGTGFINLPLINGGTLNANSSGNMLDTNANVTNTGLLEATNGGTLYLGEPGNGNNTTTNNTGGTIQANGGTVLVENILANYSSGTLTGGTYEVDADSTMTLQGDTVATNAATIVLGGANASFPAISGLNNNQGTLILKNGAAFTTAGDFSNSGTLILDPTTFTVTGNLDLTSDSVVNLDLAGTGAGEFDQLIIDGSADLAGMLNLDLLPGFTAHVGDTFDFLDATDGFTGEFTNENEPINVDGFTFAVMPEGNDLQLETTAVPEPASLSLFALGVTFLCKRRRPGIPLV